MSKHINRHIIIMAPSNDAHALAVASFLKSSHVAATHIWDGGGYCADRKISFSRGEFYLEIKGQRIRGSDIAAVWWRRPKKPDIPQNIYDQQARRHISESHRSILDSFLNSIESRVVNSISSSLSGDDKPYQLFKAKECGLETPNTLISNNFDEILPFIREMNQVVMKPLGNVYGSFPEARIVSADTIESLKLESEVCPTIFQEIISDALDLRITVVGEKIFSAGIIKNNPSALNHVDWRLDTTSECQVESLPKEIESNILRFMKSMNLQYGAIDLRKTSTGRFVFLEVNTAGQYLWVEMDTNMQISSSIADYLLALC